MTLAPWRRSWNLRYELEDVAELLRDQKESLEFSPEELDELEGRLDVIYRLRKKYGNTVEEMLDYLVPLPEGVGGNSGFQRRH